LEGLEKEEIKNQSLRTVDYSPEKAGVGGSTPSLATTFQKSVAGGQNRELVSIGDKILASVHHSSSLIGLGMLGVSY